MGERTARYAIVVDHGKVVYAEKEPGRDVTVSLLALGVKPGLTFAIVRSQAPKQSWLSSERDNPKFMVRVPRMRRDQPLGPGLILRVRKLGR
jgi:hypothetical protein